MSRQLGNTSQGMIKTQGRRIDPFDDQDDVTAWMRENDFDQEEPEWARPCAFGHGNPHLAEEVSYY